MSPARPPAPRVRPTRKPAKAEPGQGQSTPVQEPAARTPSTKTPAAKTPTAKTPTAKTPTAKTPTAKAPARKVSQRDVKVPAKAPVTNPSAKKGVAKAPTKKPAAKPPAVAPVGPVSQPGPVADRAVTQIADRFHERSRAQRHRTIRRLTWVLSAFGGIVVMSWAVLGSPLFGLDVHQVAVVGNSPYVSVDEVLAVTGEHGGVPLPRLDTVALREDLLEVRGVRDIRITRDWPRGLQVEVTAREPVAAVPDAGSVALLDEEGTVLATSAEVPAGLPVVDVAADDTHALLAVLVVLDALPDDLASEVANVRAGTQDTVTLVLKSGIEVMWGSAEDNPLKAKVLEAFLASGDLGPVAVIDVSAPSLPVLR